MCGNTPFKNTDKYLYRTWEILPKLPSESLEICRTCAIRENGSKNKKNFDKMVKERGEKYGDIEKTIQEIA